MVPDRGPTAGGGRGFAVTLTLPTVPVLLVRISPPIPRAHARPAVKSAVSLLGLPTNALPCARKAVSIVLMVEINELADPAAADPSLPKLGKPAAVMVARLPVMAHWA